MKYSLLLPPYPGLHRSEIKKLGKLLFLLEQGAFYRKKQVALARRREGKRI